MVSFYRPDQAPGQKIQTWYPWSYYDSLTMAEAMNELTFLATGLYGHELPKQNGAPIVAMEFLEQLPKKLITFWHDVVPREYDFSANVDPKVPRPKWSQATERMIDTGEVRPALPFNGYGEFVAYLYPKT